MGMLTDLIIAEPTAAQQIIREYPEQQNWPVLQMGRIDNAALGALAMAWGDAKLGQTLEEGNLTAGDSGGPWLLLLPDNFRDRLAEVRTEDISDLAAIWITQGDMAFGGWDQEIAAEALKQMRDFAIKAVKTNKPLLLWMSL